MRANRSEKALFDAGSFLAVQLGEADIQALQGFFERNPEYFIAIGGQPPEANEARDEVRSVPPEGWPYTRLWLIGFEDKTGSLIAMANVVSDLLAAGIWHVGLFIVATSLHGDGSAHAMFKASERWMRDQGARWVRLGVVKGNIRAERFWGRCGFVEVRERDGIPMAKRVNTVRVMAKSLSGGSLVEYLALVPRDRPGAP